MSNSHPFFVEVRRSSGHKEWMAIEKLEALNKQRRFKPKKYKKPIKHGWNGAMISLCFSALLLVPFGTVFTSFLAGLML